MSKHACHSKCKNSSENNEFVYSEPRIGVNENFDILEYWHLKRGSERKVEARRFPLFIKTLLLAK